MSRKESIGRERAKAIRLCDQLFRADLKDHLRTGRYMHTLG